MRFLPSPCLSFGLVSQWLSQDFHSEDPQLVHIAHQIHPLKMHGATAAKCCCTRDLVSVRHWRTTRRYWYLRDEARIPFSRTISIRLAQSIWRSRHKPTKVEGRRTVTFMGRLSYCQHLRGTRHRYWTPPTGTAFPILREAEPVQDPWRGIVVEVKGRHFLAGRGCLRRCRFASARWACNALGVNIIVERGTLNI